jgi:4-amino-4-deoxy-L-arabinose transferase-like glycosyltransferase
VAGLATADSGGSAAAAPGLIERPGTFWIVASLVGLFFVTTNLPLQLDDYDQAKQAFTSFEMVNEGQWFYQHTPARKIATKPPLVGWISAGLYGITRSWEAAWRLPSLLTAAALLFVLSRAAKAAYGRVAGLIAFAAFGLNLLSPRLATLVRTDMPLAMVVFLLGLQVWQKIRSGEPWSSRDRIVTFALLSAAMLVKGPIVYAFLLPGIAVFQLLKWKTGERSSAWCGWWPWIVSLLIFLGWAAAGIAWVPQFYEEVVLREFAGRFGETIHRPQPLYFYFPHLFHKWAPWSLLAVALAIVGWRAEKLRVAERWQRLSPDVRWLICWALGGLLVMSLIPSKRVDRIFPVIPPLCLLIAAQFSRLTNDGRLAVRIRTWSTVALVFACFWTAGYAAHKIVTGIQEERGALAEFGRAVRREAAAKNWRYEVVGRKEEGLLLYVRRTRFLKPDEAITRWNGGTLDALVAPADLVPGLLAEMSGAASSGREASIMVNRETRRYVLLTKAEPAATGE